ncbi:MAG: hypothetical protein VX438_01485 [Planctomycetota bacterium]|nr:hypothetical protein [Planctomycetota bacterium]
MSVQNCAQPDEPWEFSPYRIRTFVQLADHPTLNNAFFERLAYDVPVFAELLDRSGWRVSLEKAPSRYQHKITRGVERIELTQQMKTTDDVLHSDRIAFVNVAKSSDGYQVQTRQLDCQTHLWGPTSTRQTRYTSCLAQVIYESLQETLVPIAKIEKIEGKYVRLRIRASQIMKKSEKGVLVSNVHSPGWIDLTSIFMPVTRLNDKEGNIKLKDGIKRYDWTYLRPVEEVRNELIKTESYLRAEIHGAKRAPLAGRTNRSQRKFAVVVRPTLQQTKLTLWTRDKSPKPIPDKKIYVKYPGQEESKEIGQTNRKGEIIIEPNDQPLHLIYIKSGERRILARLPIVPGYYGQLKADMKDDKDRLRAEGVLAGFEFNFMDLTVRRQVLALRIRSALEKRKTEQARRLYGDFTTQLESRDKFLGRISKERSELMKEAGDDRQKELIYNMFSDFDVLVRQKMSPTLSYDLDQEILNVEQGGDYKPTQENLDTSNIDQNLKEEEKKSGSE